MVGLSSLKKPKVALTVYVESEVKCGMKIAATLDNTTVSRLVEQFCRDYVNDYPAVQKALGEEK